jgi:hypothetical protein
MSLTVTDGLEFMEHEERATQVRGRRATLAAISWVGLAIILIAFLLAIVRLHPANYFGLTQDDSIYFTSARAIAQGQGYILPSIPGTPKATKYPILYSWMLSWVWRWNPSFPNNLAGASAITMAFGMAFVTLTFLFLRREMAVGGLEALGLTAFCAFHPTVLFYSGSMLTEIPFSALALAAMLVANTAMKQDARKGAALGCGVLAGLSILLRVLGVPIALGILVVALVRKAWRQAAIFAATSLPFFAWVMWSTVLAAPSAPPLGSEAAGQGWTQTWLYYTSYVAFRKLGVSLHETLSAGFSQFLYLVTNIPGYFLSTVFDHHMRLWLVSSLLVLWGILHAMIRQAAPKRWQAIHFSLVFYAVIVLSWNYPEVKRFFIPFLPLFAACLWLETKWLVKGLLRATRGSGYIAEKVVAGALCATVGFLYLAIFWNFTHGDRALLSALSADRAQLFTQKLEAYDWIRRNAPQQARLIAGEDVSAYLYTGRQSMTSIALRPAGAYDSSLIREDMNHFADVAQAIDAQYWVISPDDSSKQWKSAKPVLEVGFTRVQRAFPEVFRSSRGDVRILDIGCASRPQDEACQAVRQEFFPVTVHR